MLRVSSLSLAMLLGTASVSISAQTVDSVDVTPHDVLRPVTQNTGTGVGACQQFMPWAYDADGGRVRRELTYVWSVSNSADFEVDTITGGVCARQTQLSDTVTTVVTATIVGEGISGASSFTVTPDPAAAPSSSTPTAAGPGGEGQRADPNQPTAPAPTGVTVSATSPTTLQISWGGVAGASGYHVYRSPSAGGSFTAINTALIQGSLTTDPTLMPNTTAYYKLAAIVPNMAPGYSGPVGGTTPIGTNPTGFTARAAATGSVALTWAPVPGAAGYSVLVTDRPFQKVTGTTHTVAGLPAGTHAFSLWTLYNNGAGGPDYPGDELHPAITSATIRAVPSHGTPWLTKNNGAGSPDEAGKYYTATGATANFDTFAKWKAAHGFGGRGEVSAVYFNDGDLELGRAMHCREASGKLACYVSNYGPEPGTPGFPDPEQALAAAIARGTPLATVAMERSLQRQEHGFEVKDPNGDVDTGLDIQPDDHLTITAAGGVRSCDRDTRGQVYECGVLSSVVGEEQSGCQSDLPAPCLRKYALLGKLDGYFYVGTRFFGYPTIRRPSRLFMRANIPKGESRDSPDLSVTVKLEGYRVKFLVYGPDGLLQRQAVLDTEGPKSVPHVCLSCHGGSYEPQTQTVGGASFLPFDVFTFRFPETSGYRLADQQEAFRKLNAMVKRSRPNWNNPHNPIAGLIDGMYGGGVDVAGRAASDAYVPSQWAAKPNVYDAVVKRYCRTCHLALGEELDLTSAAQFQAVASRVQSAVCYLRSMPHAEVPYRKLWLSELPHLPGYLEDASVLGVKCVTP